MEYMDLYYKDGTYAGRHIRGNKIPEDCYVHIVSIFVMNSKGQLLLTKRAKGKSYEGLWENTAGGVDEGETTAQAASRELGEETGIDIVPEHFVYLGCMETFKRKSWMHAYFAKVDKDISDIKLQEGETSDAKWLDLTWDLCFDHSIAFPVRLSLIYFWQELNSFNDDLPIADPHFQAPNRYSPWLSWAKRMQFLAQQGQAYANNPFDKDRFDQISKLSVEMLSYKTGISERKVLNLFAYDQKTYRTPSIEVRAAVFRDDRILMVKEGRSGQWSLPGGWCDCGISLSENAAKEVYEEAGLEVEMVDVIAIEDRSKNDYKYVVPFDIYKIFVLCKEKNPVNEENQLDEKNRYIEGGIRLKEFKENPETLAAGFFSLDSLPDLSLARVTERTIKNCYARKDKNSGVFFD